MTTSSHFLEGVLRVPGARVAGESTAPSGKERPRGRVDLAHLRSPHEIPAVIASVAMNFTILAVAIAILWYGAEWLERFPAIAERRTELRLIVLVTALAPPATVLGRHLKLFTARGNGVLVSAEQAPELYMILRQECDALGMKEIPQLYVSREVEGLAEAHSVFGRRSCVVLNAELIDDDWRSELDALAFAIGHGLGSLRMGHTRWWLEMLTIYATSMPLVRTPVLEAYTFSRDRCAAFAVPGGIRGLLITASGKELLPHLHVRAYIEQAQSFRGFWAWLSGTTRTTPHLCHRVRTLYDTGFFDLDRDLARFLPEQA